MNTASPSCLKGHAGLTGGANAKENCILLSVKSMDRILEISELNQTVTVEPGIVNQDLKDALRPHGMLYPPDLGSVGMSTIGGTLRLMLVECVA